MENVIANAIAVIILLAIVSGIVWYLLKAKKRGETCIGCPHAKQCANRCAGQKCNGSCSQTERKNNSV